MIKLKYIVFFCFFASLTDAEVKGLPKHGKIIGGSAVTAEDVPYQLQLENEGWTICGASIIAPFFALTTASCADGWDQRKLTLRAGSDRRSSGGHLYQVFRISIHPKYDDYYKDYDVAVLEVATPFRIDSTTQIVPLASVEPSAAALARISGWGQISEEGSDSLQLLAVDIPIFLRTNCTIVYAGDISDRMICAGLTGQDGCEGDTGGALVSDGIQVGIRSWGYGCAREGYPGVYTNVANPEILSFVNGLIKS